MAAGSDRPILAAPKCACSPQERSSTPSLLTVLHETQALQVSPSDAGRESLHRIEPTVEARAIVEQMKRDGVSRDRELVKDEGSGGAEVGETEEGGDKKGYGLAKHAQDGGNERAFGPYQKVGTQSDCQVGARNARRKLPWWASASTLSRPK